jgi:hypothetical protein
MRRVTEEDLTLRDATGKRFLPRPLAVKLTDTVVRSVALAVLLVGIGLVWEAFH